MGLPSELNPAVRSRTQGSAFAGPTPDPTAEYFRKKREKALADNPPAPQKPVMLTPAQAREQKSIATENARVYSAQAERTLDLAGVSKRQVPTSLGNITEEIGRAHV